MNQSMIQPKQQQIAPQIHNHYDTFWSDIKKMAKKIRQKMIKPKQGSTNSFSFDDHVYALGSPDPLCSVSRSIDGITANLHLV